MQFLERVVVRKDLNTAIVIADKVHCTSMWMEVTNKG